MIESSKDHDAASCLQLYSGPDTLDSLEYTLGKKTKQNKQKNKHWSIMSKAGRDLVEGIQSPGRNRKISHKGPRQNPTNGSCANQPSLYCQCQVQAYSQGGLTAFISSHTLSTHIWKNVASKTIPDYSSFNRVMTEDKIDCLSKKYHLFDLCEVRSAAEIKKHSPEILQYYSITDCFAIVLCNSAAFSLDYSHLKTQHSRIVAEEIARAYHGASSGVKCSCDCTLSAGLIRKTLHHRRKTAAGSVTAQDESAFHNWQPFQQH